MATIKSIASFNEGQQVICQNHGLGQINAVKKLEYRGNEMTVYEIFFERDSLNLMVPIGKIKEMGVRRLCSKEIASKVFEVLKKSSRAVRGMWSRRAQEYEAKMHSGSLLLTTEVVRDLFGGVGDPNRSYSERVIYEEALYRIVSEVAAVLKSTQPEIEVKIIDILTATYGSALKKVENKEHEDEFEDEIEATHFDDDVQEAA
jgi:CarD family transcriptional regulator